MKSYLTLTILLLSSLFAGAQVTQQWANRFNTPCCMAGFYDMTHSDSGFTYISGYLGDTTTGEIDAVVAKISPSGNILWYRTYGVPNWDEYFYSIDYDDSGNVYVSGSQYTQSYFPSSMVVKYSAGGQFIWRDTLIGDPSLCTLSPSNGSVLTLINNRNVTLQKHVGNSLLWQVRNDTTTSQSNWVDPVIMSVDSSGNILVAGNKNMQYYFVKKFSSSGTFLWENGWNPTLSIDRLNDLAIDKFGNTYIVGTTNNLYGGFGIAKFYPSGSIAWKKIYNNNVASCSASSIAVDSIGNAYVECFAGAPLATYPECRVIKYDSAGNYIWGISEDTAGAGGKPDIVLDKSGNIYFNYTKRQSVSSSFTDYFVARIDPSNGSEVWKTNYNDPANRSDAAYKTCIDKNHDVFVTGHESGIGTNYITTVKYSQNVGISELSPGSGISYYPNPFTDKLTVTAKNDFRSANFILYSALGENVLEQTNLQGRQFSINRGSLSPGIYFIRITDEGKSWSGKVIIE